MTVYLRIRLFGEKHYVNIEDIADVYAQKLGGSPATKEENRQVIRDDPQIIIDYLNGGNLTWDQCKAFIKKYTVEREAKMDWNEALINGEKRIVKD